VTSPAPLADADRDRFVAVLREHFAADRLSMEEFQRRVEIVLRASDALEAAVAFDGLVGTAVAGGRRRRRWGKRHAEVAEPATGWLPTAECFRDPASGAVMRVWVDPVDGSRHYVPDS